MRTLVIGNDSRHLSALKSVLKTFGECKEAVDRETAILLFQNAFVDSQSFNLVTVDMTMQDRSETSIIKEIRKIENDHRISPGQDACVMVISNIDNKQLITDCVLDGCNGFFDQDFKASHILEKLTELNLIDDLYKPANESAEIIDSRQLIEKATSMIKCGDFSLPPAPKLAMRIRQLIGSNAEIGAIENLLKHDLSISGKLIKLSNSIVYGGIGKNTSVGQALRRLGTTRTLEMVMAICCRGYFVTSHPAYKQLVEDLWWHSIACAYATDMIIEFKGLNLQEDLFSLGLLHDIGKLLLVQAVGDLQRPKRSNFVVKSEDLQAMTNSHHQPIGSKLLKIWGYSDDFASLIQINRASRDMLPGTAKDVLRQADLLAIGAGFTDGIETDVDTQEALTEVEIPPEVQEQLKAQIISRIEELRYVFG